MTRQPVAATPPKHLHSLTAVVGFLVAVEIASGVLQGFYTPIWKDIAHHLSMKDADVNWFEAAQLILSALSVPLLARLGDLLGHKKVLLLSLNYFGIVTASLGMLFFIPQIIKSLGVTNNMTVGWLTMIPYICGAISMVVWGRISDRMQERRDAQGHGGRECAGADHAHLPREGTCRVDQHQRAATTRARSAPHS
mgnify:CR=1 FL=1